MDSIAFVEQEFGEIGAVLAGNAANQCGPVQSSWMSVRRLLQKSLRVDV